MVTTQPDRQPASTSPVLTPHEPPRNTPVGVGPIDRLSTDEVLALFPSVPVWSNGSPRARRCRLAGARKILDWLTGHPGQGWQQRWLAAGADDGVEWIDSLIVGDTRAHQTRREEITGGLVFLLLCRTVLPSYTFLSAYSPNRLFAYVRQTWRPDLFAAIEQQAVALGALRQRREEAVAIICKLVVHTGRDVDQLTAEDVFEFRAWVQQRGRPATDGRKRPNLAWDLLSSVADLGEHRSLRDALRLGQRSTADLVDSYRIQSRAIRDVFIRYLNERRPAFDHRSFHRLIADLVGAYWADIEHHHPGIDTLRLPDDVATAWKQRLRVVTAKDGTTRPRRGYLDVLVRVRSFYLDLQQWAVEDPSWVAWAVPSPIRRGETDGMAKAQRQVTARMHQRVRDRLPHLPALVEAAERHRADQAALLTAARAAEPGQTIQHGECLLRRTAPKSHTTSRGGPPPPVLVEDITTGEQVDLTRRENDAFWAWAIIETLRHTGIRVEELGELTHLAVVSYQLPDTGEIVPMLQIVPSKSDQERLLLVGPELASVLATIISRLRNHNNGTVALTARYDPHERVLGPPLPHLFQRRQGWRWSTIPYTSIQNLLCQTLTRAGLRDAAGQPLRYTPHDFRRIFATDAVAGGLPIHIVARLLGHANINTTQAYLAVFDDELVRAYRAFLDRRRAVRPEAEYRQPTDTEWREFQQHFQTRKLELGDCGRPYGTPCKHEHACIRCPSLRLDPAARPRLANIIANLADRIQEAHMNGWLGEVHGLQASLHAATDKLVSLDRTRRQPPSGPVDLGLPVITDPR